MVLRSERTATLLDSLVPATAQIHTLRDFLQLLHARGIERVQLEEKIRYRSTILNDSGSQFTIFDDQGIKNYGQPIAVVKCAKFQLGTFPLLQNERKRGLITSLHRELIALTHQSLRTHPNIVRILYYDLVDDVENTVVPALVLERAHYGSLANLLDEYSSITVPEENQVSLCADVTAGLLAIHNAGIAHGDVKADNVLVFQSANTMKPYIAKLTDFGSIISLSQSEAAVTRYYGTRLFNAPEVDSQSAESSLDARGLIACDNYSLGLLFVQIIAHKLNERLTAKDRCVLAEARRLIEGAQISKELISAVIIAIESLLPWEPQKRCSDLTFVLNVLRAPGGSGLHVTDSEESATTVYGRTESQITVSIESTFEDAEYLEYEFADDVWTPRHIQQSTFAEITESTKSRSSVVAGRALLQLAIAHSIGFGTQQNTDLALKSVLDAAALNYLPAQAMFEVWHKSSDREVAVDLEKQLDWLYEASVWGSFYADASLRRIDLSEYRLARWQFHAQGGYNQYFHPRNRPSHIGSAEFKHSMSETNWKPEGEALSALLQSAVIYGDAPLTRELLNRYRMDPNQINRYGETLLILCCKGGHLDVLKELVSAGARTKLNDEDDSQRESALHWLIAFEDCDVEGAVSLLVEAGADKGRLPGILWNHPTIDFPGKFPRATPLHFATYCIKPLCVKALLKHWPAYINETGPVPEIGTPLEYALSLYRFDIAELFAQYKALDDIRANAKCLLDIGMVMNHEAWAISGAYGLPTEHITRKCIETVAKRAIALLDLPGDHGFTPLMQAAQSHARDVVATLIDYGCNVNAATSYENDDRTALNLLTENRHDCQNDTFELLVEAGADLNHKSSKGGKMLIHSAARDDSVAILRKALNRHMNINVETDLGETPLHIAAYYGAYGACQLLLERGANAAAANTKHSHGKYDWKAITPIGIATIVRNLDIISLFLEALGPLARPSTGISIPHLAVIEHDVDFLETLLERDDIQEKQLLNATASENRTALHICAGNADRHGHARLLINEGADVNAVTEAGYSVLDVAYQTLDRINEIISTDHGGGLLWQQLDLPSEASLKLHWLNNEGEDVQDHVLIGGQTVDDLKNYKEGFNNLIGVLEYRGAKREKLEGVAEGLLFGCV